MRPAAILFALVLTGCITSSDAASSDLDEIDCTGILCDWTVKEGQPQFGPTWHDGDLGVDLSESDRVVLELKDVLFESQHDRQLQLRSVLVRDPEVQLSFDLDFYGVGQMPGATFWDRNPTFLVTRHYDVVEQGVTTWHRPVLIPSEGAALVLRVTKNGAGRAMIDEVTLGQ
ncbi:MAG TPA: hypothetical protein VIF62_17890 [Labilithrix sp.]